MRASEMRLDVRGKGQIKCQKPESFVFSHLLANTFCGGEEGQLRGTPSILLLNSTYLRSLREDTLSHKETKAPSELAAIHLGSLREDVDVETDLGINCLLCQDVGNQVVRGNAVRSHDSSLKMPHGQWPRVPPGSEGA
jgi:hypothetical protein